MLYGSMGTAHKDAKSILPVSSVARRPFPPNRRMRVRGFASLDLSRFAVIGVWLGLNCVYGVLLRGKPRGGFPSLNIGITPQKKSVKNKVGSEYPRFVPGRTFQFSGDLGTCGGASAVSGIHFGYPECINLLHRSPCRIAPFGGGKCSSSCPGDARPPSFSLPQRRVRVSGSIFPLRPC